jgi:small subunit ribosomal protein S3
MNYIEKNMKKISNRKLELDSSSEVITHNRKNDLGSSSEIIKRK